MTTPPNPPTIDRPTVVREMYEAYLDAHDDLVAGTAPSDIPRLRGFSERLDDDTIFRFPALGVEVRGRAAIERFMVESRQGLGLREWSEHAVEHGDLVVSCNRSSFTSADDRSTGMPIVAVFRFDGERVLEFWGFPG